MTRYTDRWGLSILGAGDSLQSDGFKFTDADRQLIDRLLAYAVEGHHHSGASGTDHTPMVGLSLTLQTTGGSIASGTRYYYRYTIVDSGGYESAASPIESIDTPIAVNPPQAPSAEYLTGTGDLGPGTYSYVCSAYASAHTLETKALNSAALRVAGTNPNNSITLTLPDLPLGATGLNVYRLAPNGLHYLYITSIDAPVRGQTWLDDGSIDGDCDRGLPALNRTANDNLIFVSLPGATPSIPDGWSWRIYRADNPTDWSRSFLADVTPQGATPVVPTTYPDAGAATLLGSPPVNAQVLHAPDKVLLTNAAEVTGSLPSGRLVVPHVVTFTSAGPLDVAEGTFTWVCDYDQADIIHCRAHLGVDSVPAADDVIVDVNALRPSAGSSTWTSIYGDGPDRPTVPIGQNVGVPTAPAIRHLALGDALCVDIDQIGGGATPTDENLTVNILMYVQYGPADTSYVWAP